MDSLLAAECFCDCRKADRVVWSEKCYVTAVVVLILCCTLLTYAVASDETHKSCYRTSRTQSLDFLCIHSPREKNKKIFGHQILERNSFFVVSYEVKIVL